MHTTRQQAHEFYRRILAEAKAAGGESAQMATMTELGRRDLFYLLVYLLKRKDVDRDWLFDRCREVQLAPDGYLDLWARFHYKSTIITFGQTIRDVLIDPEITFGIFSHNRPIAKGFLRWIKRELEKNKLLKELYPEVLYAEPKRQSEKWSENDGLTVKRRGNPKEATIEAWGLVDGQPTSKHFGRRLYDDVVTKNTVGTPEMIKKTTEAWELSLALGTEGGRARYAGTFYHLLDTYHDIIEREAAMPRIYPATVDGTVEGEPVLITKEELAKHRREMGPYTFGCQMLLNPVADQVQGFVRKWLNFWTVAEAGWRRMNRYITVDPASEKKADNDYSVFAVIGLAEDGNTYLIDMVRDRLNLAERTETLFKLHRRYRPLKVGYEKYGMQADIEHIKGEMEREHYRFAIVELGGQMAKNDRIRRLIPDFAAGRFYLPARLIYVDREKRAHDLSQEFVDDEYLAFPVGRHDDMLDCLARIKDDVMGVLQPQPAPDPAQKEFAASAVRAAAAMRRPAAPPLEFTGP